MAWFSDMNSRYQPRACKVHSCFTAEGAPPAGAGRRDNLSMRPPGDRSAWSLLVMAAAVGLLLVLAFFQHQWIGRLSQAEQERLQAHLRAAIWRFTQEFNAESARVLMVLYAGRPAPPERELAELAERYQGWRDAAPHPELVRNFYAARGGPAGLDELLLYRPDQASFQPVAWPERFAGLRPRLSLVAAEGAWGGLFARRGVVDEDGAVLAAPRFRAAPAELRGRGRRGERAGPLAGWAIAELDLDFLLRSLLPELVDRHFRRVEGFDFQLQVVRKADRKVLYRSEPGLPDQPLSAPDATAGIFDFRFGPPRALFEAALGRPAGEGVLLAPPGEPVRVEPEGRWQLLVKHRAGSLEAAVEQVRRRNLALSAAILLLMALSLAMLIVSTQRAQRLARLQMEFVAGVSHELRTPLAVICSAGDNLADGLVAGGEQAQRYGALIRTEGRRLTEMVEQILTFAGAQAGRLKYHFQPVDVGEVIERVTSALTSAAQQAGVALESRVEPETPQVIADPVALAQCLRNLINNALKYAASGQWVGVSAAPADGGRRIEIRVEDRGPGIPPADLPHIFEPFYRGRNAGQAQTHGAGLGLSLVKGVIEAHRGTVRVESRPGEGTRFILRLPAAGPSQERGDDHAG
jgi:signal transduction histidine kinase